MWLQIALYCVILVLEGLVCRIFWYSSCTHGSFAFRKSLRQPSKSTIIQSADHAVSSRNMVGAGMLHSCELQGLWCVGSRWIWEVWENWLINKTVSLSPDAQEKHQPMPLLTNAQPSTMPSSSKVKRHETSCKQSRLDMSLNELRAPILPIIIN